jgi:hypothetical protein
MARSTKVSLKTTLLTVLVRLRTKMVILTKETGSRIKQKVQVCICTFLEPDTMDSGFRTNNMGTVKRFGQMVLFI